MMASASSDQGEPEASPLLGQQTSQTPPTNSPTEESNSTCTTSSVFAVLYNLLTFFLWIYGIVIIRAVDQSKLVGVCSEEAAWVNICSIFGLLMFCPLMTVALVPKLKALTECVYGLVAMFLFVWLIYGATLFFQESANKCPPAIHYFGFVLAIMFVSVSGLVCCCSMMIMTNREWVEK